MMKKGHSFKKMHGFTGSANEGADFRPTIPGYKRGGMIGVNNGKAADSGYAVTTAKKMAKGGCMKRGGKVKKR